EGNTTWVTLGLSLSQDSNYMSATIALSGKDLPNGQSFDDLNKKDFLKIANAKLVKMVNDETSEAPKPVGNETSEVPKPAGNE
ncbi:hypothetical protein ACYJ1U_09160, partial [Pediococcus pentosaceus]